MQKHCPPGNRGNDVVRGLRLKKGEGGLCRLNHHWHVLRGRGRRRCHRGRSRGRGRVRRRRIQSKAASQMVLHICRGMRQRCSERPYMHAQIHLLTLHRRQHCSCLALGTRAKQSKRCCTPPLSARCWTDDPRTLAGTLTHVNRRRARVLGACEEKRTLGEGEQTSARHVRAPGSPRKKQSSRASFDAPSQRVAFFRNLSIGSNMSARFLVNSALRQPRSAVLRPAKPALAMPRSLATAIHHSVSGKERRVGR